MIKCPVCGKQKSAFQMRPIVNIEELKVGAAMSDQPTEQEVAGQKVDVVCRECWMQILNSRTKEEVIEILETICGVLLEADNRMKERPFHFGDVVIEKAVAPPSPNIVIQPLPHIYSDRSVAPSIWEDPSSSGAGQWRSDLGTTGNMGNISVSSGFTNWLATVHRGDNSGKD
jgi:hypothetical protein